MESNVHRNTQWFLCWKALMEAQEHWLVKKAKAKKDLKPSFKPSDSGVHARESLGKAYLLSLRGCFNTLNFYLNTTS